MRGMALVGEQLSARPTHRQTAELRIRATLLNHVTHLSSPETQGVA